MLRPPRPQVHQGAVYRGVPIAWISPPLWLIRPKDRTFPEMSPRRVDETHDAFAGGDGQEVVLAMAKARPVVVLSSYAELRRLRQVRVAPLYSYRSESGVGRLRQPIIEGRVGAAFHLSGDQSLGVHEGALRLDQMQAVNADLLVHPVASLADSALAALVEHAARYLRALDRRPVA